MSTATKRLIVELPCCPVEGCENVGKIPANAFQGKLFCVGSKDFRHAKTRMEVRKFREVR